MMIIISCILQIGRGWSVNMGYLGYFTMGENDVRKFPELGLTLRMNGTHMHVELARLHVIWDGVTTAHIVLKDQIRFVISIPYFTSAALGE